MKQKLAKYRGLFFIFIVFIVISMSNYRSERYEQLVFGMPTLTMDTFLLISYLSFVGIFYIVTIYYFFGIDHVVLTRITKNRRAILLVKKSLACFGFLLMIHLVSNQVFLQHIKLIDTLIYQLSYFLIFCSCIIIDKVYPIKLEVMLILFSVSTFLIHL